MDAKNEIRDYVAACRFYTGSSFTVDGLYVSVYVSNKEYAMVGDSNQLAGDPRVVCRAILDTCEDVTMGPDEFKARLKGHEVGTSLREYLEKVVYVDFVGDTLCIRGNNLCEVFDLLYKDANIYVQSLYNYFKERAYGVGRHEPIPSFRFVRTLADAVAPRKNKASDSGYDLVLVKKLKQAGNVTYYDTGIQLAPPVGWYFDLVGRSSISKSGYMLANNVGIIDQSYRGNVMVALVKVDPEVPELELPSRLVQIIPRRVWHMQPVECDSLETTSRGDGGFGSSGGSRTHMQA